ncbi:MAG: GMC family oxidoreductase, partial [Pseudomonadota bacterium]
LLLESGGWHHEPDTHALTRGATIGQPYYELDEARLRFFGGTLNIWGGRCVPLDDIDFTRRDWVEYSGWPISSEELRPYYESAHQAFELGPFDYGNELWRQFPGAGPAFDSRLFTSRFWRFDEARERFGQAGCKDLPASSDVTVLLHANAVNFHARANADSIGHLTMSTLEGKRGSVVAGAFVLACGGLENPRILLASNDVESTGIGNRHDQLGRYFMEHPHARAGFLKSGRAYDLWSAYRKRYFPRSVPLAPVLCPSNALQKERRILNTVVTFKLQRSPGRGIALDKRLYFYLKHRIEPDRTGLRVWHAYRRMRAWRHRHLRSFWERLRAGLGMTGLSVIVRAEQAPNPQSRVRLGHEKDALGMPRLELDWRLGEQDKRTVAVLAELLADELERLGIGRLQVSDWLQENGTGWPVDATIGNHPIGGFHHMGTTRMSADPARGVVDADCRVHGYGNLFVAGSSVFPTGGWANPTLTIVALAHRLADHLLARKSHPPLAGW